MRSALPASVDVAAVALFHVPQRRDARGRVHVAVEGLVGRHEFLVLAGGVADTLAVDAGLQPLDQQGIGLLRQHVHDFQLDRPSQEVRLARRGDVDAADHRGVLRIDLDQGFLGQFHERVADRRLAQAVGLGQRHARQRRAGRQFEGHDLFAQMFEDLRRGVSRAVQSELVAGHRSEVR